MSPKRHQTVVAEGARYSLGDGSGKRRATNAFTMSHYEDLLEITALSVTAARVIVELTKSVRALPLQQSQPCGGDADSVRAVQGGSATVRNGMSGGDEAAVGSSCVQRRRQRGRCPDTAIIEAGIGQLHGFSTLHVHLRCVEWVRRPF